jgi:hypothetical protein
VGVTLPVNKASLVDYKLQTRYNKWEFNYDPMEDQMQQSAGLFGGGSTGTGLEGMSTSGFGGTTGGPGGTNPGSGGTTGGSGNTPILGPNGNLGNPNNPNGSGGTNPQQ